tara:strand:+ start:391 stop:702 length:312 start_codon:yes stop_codon:yes gene_type:complete
LPDENIVTYGEPIYDMVMIQESVVSCHLRVDKPHLYRHKYEEFLHPHKPIFLEFFILPTFSYFGDFQILYDLKSQITYRAANDKKYKLMIALCLSKENLMNLM